MKFQLGEKEKEKKERRRNVFPLEYISCIQINKKNSKKIRPKGKHKNENRTELLKMFKQWFLPTDIEMNAVFCLVEFNQLASVVCGYEYANKRTKRCTRVFTYMVCVYSFGHRTIDSLAKRIADSSVRVLQCIDRMNAIAKPYGRCSIA